METVPKKQVEIMLKWMLKNRAQYAGFGAPITMLKSMLRDDDISGFANAITKSEKNDKSAFNSLPLLGISDYADEV